MKSVSSAGKPSDLLRTRRNSQLQKLNFSVWTQYHSGRSDSWLYIIDISLYDNIGEGKGTTYTNVIVESQNLNQQSLSYPKYAGHSHYRRKLDGLA